MVFESAGKDVALVVVNVNHGLIGLMAQMRANAHDSADVDVDVHPVDRHSAQLFPRHTGAEKLFTNFLKLVLLV